MEKSTKENKAVYLDYNATAPLLPCAKAAMMDAMDIFGNPSSIHGFGRAARKMVETARAQVAALVGVTPAQVIFNAGATEGNNTILSAYRDQVVFISAGEHASILEAAPHAHKIPLLPSGQVDVGAFGAMVAKTPPALVCLHWVNNETGVIQPVAEVAAIAKSVGAKVHCDAVQGAGRLPLSLTDLGVDTLAITAHKLGGPKGVGALIFRQGVLLPKFMQGGGQEKRQRAGTENVVGIAGFGAAATYVMGHIGDYQQQCTAYQTALEKGLMRIANDCIILGHDAPRVANTTNVLLPGVMAETQIMAMDLAGIALSSGSACSSGSIKPSHVLTAMGLDDSLAKSALRFSCGWDTTMADIDAALIAYQTMAARTRQGH